MQYTTNYNLKKPGTTDPADIADLNSNADTIDLKIKERETEHDGLAQIVSTNSADIDAIEADIAFPATNLVTNGDFSNGTTRWLNGSDVPVSVLNNEVTFKASWQYGRFSSVGNYIAGNKYYVKSDVKSTSNLVKLFISRSAGNEQAVKSHSGSGSYEPLSGIVTLNSPTSSPYAGIQDHRVSGWDNIYIKNVLSIDLTATFGAGNEPTVAEMDAIIAKYPNSWFDGTVNPLLTPKQMLDLIRAKANIVQENWITPTLLNGATSDATDPVMYRKTSTGRIIFKGRGTFNLGYAMLLPIGYKIPTNKNARIPIVTVSGTTVGVFAISSGNAVFVSAGTFSLDGVAFEAEA